MEETFHLRWGILGTGRIAEGIIRKRPTHTPANKRTTDIVHLLSGVASSRSEDVAQEFITAVQAPSYCQAYGDYSDLVNCPTIDVIYIATPHSHHFQNAMLALEAGKHVLCEKSFTVNAGQAKKLFTVAKKKQHFLMEGLWTQFLPVRAVIRVFADNGLGIDPYSDFPPGDRMVVKELAGRALLDLDVYSIHWVLQAMPKGNRRPIQILSTATEYPISGVDETTTILMRFALSTADGPEIQAMASASLRAITDLDGETAANLGTISIDKTDLLPDGLYGLCFEADEVAHCIYQGLLESPEMPWLESLTVMEIMDTVRRENNHWFPEEIETLEYPVTLPSKTS
ncbi:MviM [Aspergillus parasiticus SU-1]|uniref:D-xylose 1-dehydrogenase (NADP(+), D-xylono-1,5-lactone-forming) n=1 Tax=Aspergillus parasiticus (strain ATCC 56775 / NRRL 5862 / SRRC 143 / SU-1) TaxID=1403190 RepID=A0A0F0I0W1_ASPPU|nr:MviM [Aspergillus parasiticus SU-1]